MDFTTRTSEGFFYLMGFLDRLVDDEVGVEGFENVSCIDEFSWEIKHAKWSKGDC